MAGSVATSEVAGLWLATLQRLVDRVAHDVRNTLNGVAVNLEVVRSRSAREGTSAAAVAPFAATAATQFETLSAAAEALLSLARPSRAPADVPGVLRQLAALAGGADVAADGEGVTQADGDAVRLVLASVHLAALDAGRSARYDVSARDGAVAVRCLESGPIRLDPDVERAGRAAGITLADAAGVTEIRFPR